MFPKSVTSIRTLINTFPTEQSCIEHLEKMRWKGKPVSPFDTSSLVWKCKDGKRYICSKTRKYFTVRTRSIYEKTKVPLRDWFVAMWLMNNNKRGNFIHTTFKRNWRNREDSLVYGIKDPQAF